jgi:hypothetical protein
MRFLSALMPREVRFFDLFDRHGAFVGQGADAILELVRNYADTTRRAELIQKIGDTERSADKSPTNSLAAAFTFALSTATTSTG